MGDLGLYTSAIQGEKFSVENTFYRKTSILNTGTPPLTQFSYSMEFWAGKNRVIFLSNTVFEPMSDSLTTI